MLSKTWRQFLSHKEILLKHWKRLSLPVPLRDHRAKQKVLLYGDEVGQANWNSPWVFHCKFRLFYVISCGYLESHVDPSNLGKLRMICLEALEGFVPVAGSWWGTCSVTTVSIWNFRMFVLASGEKKMAHSKQKSFGSCSPLLCQCKIIALEHQSSAD